MGIDLVVGVGGIERRAFLHLQHHLARLAGQGGIIWHTEIMLLGQIEQLLITFSVILDHLLGKRLYLC
ncbi:hypothetical protein D3C76_1298820 [compost metagenome]